MGGSSHSRMDPNYQRQRNSHQITKQRLQFQQQKSHQYKQQLAQSKKQLIDAKNDIRLHKVQLKIKEDKIKQLEKLIDKYKNQNLQLKYKAKKYKAICQGNNAQISMISKSKISSSSRMLNDDISISQDNSSHKFSNNMKFNKQRQSHYFQSAIQTQSIQQALEQSSSRFDTPQNSKQTVLVEQAIYEKQLKPPQQFQYVKKRTQTQMPAFDKKNLQKSISSLNQSSIHGSSVQLQDDKLSLDNKSYKLMKSTNSQQAQKRLFNTMGKIYYKLKNSNSTAKQHWSSGFIVQINQVMTCASFFFDQGKLINSQDYDIRFYPHFLAKEHKYINVKEIFIHSDFKDTGKPIEKRFNDVAIVQLVMQNSMKNINYLQTCTHYAPQLFEYVSIVGYTGNQNSNGPQKYFLSSNEVQLKKIQTKVKSIFVYNNQTGQQKQVNKVSLTSYIDNQNYSVAINFDIMKSFRHDSNDSSSNSLFDAGKRGESLVSLKGTPILVQVVQKNKFMYYLAGINEGAIAGKKNIAILLSKNILSHTLPYKDGLLGSK